VRPHPAQVGIPAVVSAVDGDLALGFLVVRIGFGRTAMPTEIFGKTVVALSCSASVITNFVTVDRPTCSGSVRLFSVGMGIPVWQYAANECFGA